MSVDITRAPYVCISAAAAYIYIYANGFAHLQATS